MRVFVATPAYNSPVSTSYMGSVLSLPQAGVAVEWLSVDDSLVSRARNTLVAKFLESRAEPLLFVDADFGFDPLQIVAMLNFGQEFVAGVAPVKDYFPDGLRYAATTCTTPERDASGRFITAERVGGSLMLLKRTVFEQMIAAYPGTRHTYDFVSRKGENLDCFALFDLLIIDEKYFPRITHSATAGARLEARFG
jgi:hypothetical protein